MWAPQPGPQVAAIDAAWCPELLFGGARGGGKSDFLLGDYAAGVPIGEAWRGVLFRRTYPELEELIARSRALYPQCFPGAEYRESSKDWRFPSGATLRMRYIERDADASRYQGHQYTWIGWDELTQWPSNAPYKMLFACLRSAANVPHKRIRSSANPGGPGHQWVKARFIDPAPRGYELLRDGSERMFIPSKVQDNRALLDADPTYIDRLRMVGSAELVRAWLEGDWDVVTGAYFDCWGPQHVLRPCELPDHWLRFRSLDWGSFRPFSIGWWAVASEDFDHDEGRIPKGALVRVNEWYGASEPNVGLKLTVEQVAAGILDRTASAQQYTVADPATFIQDGGPSIAERMLKAGVPLRRGDNKRVPGWEQVRGRLVGEERPMLYFFSNCADSIRTLPSLQHDDTRPEDIDTDGEDHAADEIRYACMSRPYTKPMPSKNEPRWDRTFIELRDLVSKRRQTGYE